MDKLRQIQTAPGRTVTKERSPSGSTYRKPFLMVAKKSYLEEPRFTKIRYDKKKKKRLLDKSNLKALRLLAKPAIWKGRGSAGHG